MNDSLPQSYASRRHVARYYFTTTMGKFTESLVPGVEAPGGEPAHNAVRVAPDISGPHPVLRIPAATPAMVTMMARSSSGLSLSRLRLSSSAWRKFRGSV